MTAGFDSLVQNGSDNMDEAFVTRCPKCKTAFKVNPNLLAKANGKVRCGACLCVFDAEDHIQFASDELENSAPAAQVVMSHELDEPVFEKPAPTPKPVEKLTTKPAPRKVPPQGFKRTEPQLGDTRQVETPVSATDLPQPTSQNVDDFTRNLTSEADEEFIFEDDPNDLFDDDDDAPQAKDNAGIGEISEDFLNYRADESMQNQFEPRAAGFTDDDDDEAWAKSLVEDDKPTATPDSYSLVDDDFEADTQPKTSSVNVTQYVPPPASSITNKGSSKVASKTASKAKSAPNRATGGALAIEEIESHHNHGQGFFNNTLWTLLAVVLALVLAAQYAWFQRDQLSQISSLRPIYDTACELAGCTLPALTDVSAVNVANNQVRINPADPGTVLVDLVLRNQAGFEQPFPQVIVTFLNDQGRTTQRYRVNPQQYLTGNIKPNDLMPTGVAVQVQLKLENPGNVARYRIDLADTQ